VVILETQKEKEGHTGRFWGPGDGRKVRKVKSKIPANGSG